MMKLSTLDFVKLLPQFMRDDSAVRGLAAGINQIIPRLSAAAGKLSTWDCIDDLTETELDELAWELNILWYDIGASVAIKRELIKNSDKIYERLGTKWAVENVIETYFGEGHVEEWWEYSGAPGHFRVISGNPSLSNEKLAEFINIATKVKRASAKFDGVYISLSGEMCLAAGAAVHDIGIEQYTARAQ